MGWPGICFIKDGGCAPSVFVFKNLALRDFLYVVKRRVYLDI